MVVGVLVCFFFLLLTYL